MFVLNGKRIRVLQHIGGEVKSAYILYNSKIPPTVCQVTAFSKHVLQWYYKTNQKHAAQKH
uniref:Uncharacterized protein n=1 Tax=Anguilla anguilla TaxID=7936 RepID=A0A0E9UMN4_ANGAN